MTTLYILKELRRIFTKKDRWVKGKLCALGAGSPIKGTSYKKVCVVGGINLICRGDPHTFSNVDIEKVARALRIPGKRGAGEGSLWFNLVKWNNNYTTTFNSLVKRIDTAIARKEAGN